MEWWPVNLPVIGWATAVSLVAAVLGSVILRYWARKDQSKEEAKQREREANERLDLAEKTYRAAVAEFYHTGDVERLRLAAKRLHNARRK